jgi:heat shock protein HslJ/membrane-bound inhibitor of C-type lysozyme
MKANRRFVIGLLVVIAFAISTSADHAFSFSLAEGVSEFVNAHQSSSELGGTSWQLVKFQGSDGKVLTPDDKSKYTIAFGTDGNVTARIDCNRGRGTWKSDAPNQLQFGPLALTRAMCPQGSLHDRIARDLTAVRSYTMKDGHLFLSLMADGGIYEFEPMGGSQGPPVIPTVQAIGPVRYNCTGAGGATDTLTVTFYDTKPSLALIQHGNETRPAFQALAASGAKYEGRDVMFWEAQGEATVTWSGMDLKCKPQR